MKRTATFLMLAALACALAAVIVGCRGAGLVTPAQQLAASCAASAAALKTLTIANDAGKLSAATQTSVLHAIGYINPVCTAPEPPTLDSIRAEAFRRAILLLEQEAVKYSEPHVSDLIGDTP